MELTDEIKTEEYSQEKQNDIFYTLLSGKTFTEEIETSRGKFRVKFPKQKDIMQIDRRVALMRGGIPAESFDAIANFNLQKVATLDVMVESGPKWFDNLKSKNPNFSWGDMPDGNFVDEVYSKAYSFRAEVQRKFGGDEDKATDGVSDGEDVPTDVDNGVFSGVAGKSERVQ